MSGDEQCRCDGGGWYTLPVPYGHPEFGKLQLCSCTKPARDAQRATQRAHLLEQLHREMGDELARCSLDGFDLERARGFGKVSTATARESLATALATCRAYAADPYGWLYLWGPTGAGKSHLAAAVARAMAERQQRSVLYASEPALMRFLREGYDKRETSTADERMRALQDCDLLVLDDVGAAYRKKGDPDNWTDSQLVDLLFVRYQQDRPTIMTSNLHVDDLEQRVRSRIKGRTNFDYCGREQLLLVLNADQRDGVSDATQ